MIDAQAIVEGFLEGMYYAGKLPSKRESAAITAYLVRRQLKLKELSRLSVEQMVIQQMDTLHQRVGSKG